MKIRSKLMTNVLISISCLLFVGIIGYFSTNTVAKVSMSIVQEQAIPIIRLNNVEKDAWEILWRFIIHTVTMDFEDMKIIDQEIEELNTLLDQDLKEYGEIIMSRTGNNSGQEAAAWVREFQKEWTTLNNIGEQALKSSRDYAKEDALQILIKDGKPAYDRILELLQYNIEKRQEQMVLLSNKAAKARDKSVRWIVILTLATGGGVFIWMLFIARSVVKAVLNVRETVQKIADGNLSVRWHLKTRDELGQLGQVLNIMADSLEQKARLAESIAEGDLTNDVKLSSEDDVLGKALEKMTFSLRDILSRINRAAHQVANGSDQVSDSSRILSQKSAEQAASLEEITSSMSEIGAQTESNAENASQASQVAGQTRKLAEHGMSEMSNMISAMEDINSASQAIAKIIKVIDEIAFQTNLLALNAAVEAARAGRHGKGFAVVAEEVRNLASRSAKAANETEELIESAVRNVETGNEIAGQTAEALNRIMESAIKVADLVDEIAASSGEQAQGIAQVNQGLEQVDQVTQQNNVNAEETASSTEELSAQALQLKQILTQFKLNDASQYPDQNQTLPDNNQDQDQNQLETDHGNHFSGTGDVTVPRQNERGFVVNPKDMIQLDDEEFEKY